LVNAAAIPALLSVYVALAFPHFARASGNRQSVDAFAAIQFNPTPGAAAANRDRLAGFVEEAAGRGARFVVLPELCVTGPVRSVAADAEPIPGPSTDFFAGLARRRNISLGFSILERDPSDRRTYITAVLLNNSGRILRRQRKVMVRMNGVDGDVARGSFRQILDTVDVAGLRIGILSGDEIQAGVPRLANRGAETILISAEWSSEDPISWSDLARQLSHEYMVNLVIANRTVPKDDSPGLQFYPRRAEAVVKIEPVRSGVYLASISRRTSNWTIPSALGLPVSVPLPAAETSSAAIAELGRRLFFEKKLSSTGDVACATCHEPEKSFANGQKKGIGVYGRQTKRNPPSLLNVAFRPLLQWDGYASTLENFAKYPVSGESEMNFHYLDKVSAYLQSEPAYREAFRETMGVDEIEFDHVAHALATYQRTLVSADSDFDRYYYGGDKRALSAASERGLRLFTGKAECVQCHRIEDEYAFFADFRFHVTGVGWNAALGRFDDIGLGGISTGDQSGLFQTPSLRNVAETAPYMHDGSIPTLEDVVDYYNRGGSHSPRQDPQVKPLGLTAGERSDLVEFLRALTGSRKYGADGRPLEN
jgi:cytochrome c peroxidase